MFSRWLKQKILNADNITILELSAGYKLCIKNRTHEIDIVSSMRSKVMSTVCIEDIESYCSHTFKIIVVPVTKKFS